MGQSEEYFGISVDYVNLNNENINQKINQHPGNNMHLLDSLSGSLILDTIFDNEFISADYLIKNVDNAFIHYKNNPLGIVVPDSIFREYVLPYRVGYEKPHEWRSFFNKNYVRYLNTIPKDSIDEHKLIEMVHTFQSLTYHVYEKTGLANYQTSPNHSLDDIRMVSYPRSCEDYAVYKLYSFRSLGLPAAYETIPLFSKFNYGHSETALMFRDGQFHCTEGETKMPYKYQIAKMYRRQFSKVKNNPYHQIKELGEKEENIPYYFNMPNYFDITNERTIVSDVFTSSIGVPEDVKVVYLCLYNQGQWMPVEWSKKTPNRTLFKDMGRKNIFHATFYRDGDQHLYGSSFILDTLGNISFLDNHITDIAEDINVVKFDRNNEIKKGNYTLFYWNNMRHRWEKVSQFDVFENKSSLTIPLCENVLYKIHPEVRSEAVRPFTVEKGDQLWW